MTKLIRGVVGIIIDNATKRVLMTKRPPRKEFFPDHWECPGGKIEDDEVALDAIKRELHEELGIHVKKAEYLMDVESNVHLLSVFVITEYEGKPQIMEDQPDMQWFSISQVKTLKVPPLTISLLEKYQTKSL